MNFIILIFLWLRASVVARRGRSFGANSC